MSESDWKLLPRSRRDEHAMAELFRRHRDFVFRLSFGFTGDRELANDVVQEVFLRLYKVPIGVRITAKFTTWLYRVTLNVAREARRANQRYAVIELPEIVDPNADATRDARLQELMAALETVSERQREVVVLRMLEGFTTKETAEAIGCGAGTVKVHLHRALTTLTGTFSEAALQEGVSK